jgi:hypothetical protein
LAISWLTALKATAAITWRSLVANICITLAGIAGSLLLGFNLHVLPVGFAGLTFQWSRPFGAFIAVAQIAATVWAVKRAVEVTLLSPPRKLDLTQALSATWSFAWRDFVAVFGGAAIVYFPIRLFREEPLPVFDLAAILLLALWTFGPSFVWAVRGMLRAQSQALGLS